MHPSPDTPEHRPDPGQRAGGSSDAGPAKRALRDQLLAVRRARPLSEVTAAAQALAQQALQLPQVAAAGTVATYVSVGNEPGTGLLLDALAERGTRVLLPVVLDDLDLDWAHYHGPSSLAPAARGLLEPQGPRLGPDAVGEADVVLVPGLALGSDGTRLGRGGGCYDRALTRVAAGACVLAVLYADELRDHVPREDHDRTVHGALTPEGVRAPRPPDAG